MTTHTYFQHLIISHWNPWTWQCICSFVNQHHTSLNSPSCITEDSIHVPYCTLHGGITCLAQDFLHLAETNTVQQMYRHQTLLCHRTKKCFFDNNLIITRMNLHHSGIFIYKELPWISEKTKNSAKNCFFISRMNCQNSEAHTHHDREIIGF